MILGDKQVILQHLKFLLEVKHFPHRIEQGDWRQTSKHMISQTTRIPAAYIWEWCFLPLDIVLLADPKKGSETGHPHVLSKRFELILYSPGIENCCLPNGRVQIRKTCYIDNLERCYSTEHDIYMPVLTASLSMPFSCNTYTLKKKKNFRHRMKILSPESG